ncbi:hypothetical protein KM043_006377 [Ampulex compressa]|nr:hypothetical protein KM043_006377 [Ampulex compressa]
MTSRRLTDAAEAARVRQDCQRIMGKEEKSRSASLRKRTEETLGCVAGKPVKQKTLARASAVGHSSISPGFNPFRGFVVAKSKERYAYTYIALTRLTLEFCPKGITRGKTRETSATLPFGAADIVPRQLSPGTK